MNMYDVIPKVFLSCALHQILMMSIFLVSVGVNFLVQLVAANCSEVGVMFYFPFNDVNISLLHLV